MYCLCVNVYCHRVSTQLQLTNISISISKCKIQWQPHSFHSKITNSFPESLIEAETLTSSIQTAHACHTGLQLRNCYQAMMVYMQLTSELRHSSPKRFSKPVNPRFYGASSYYPKIHFPVLFDKPIFRTQIGTLPKRKLTNMTRQ
jgi:hypothetical protein